jgi:hypothetical protein
MARHRTLPRKRFRSEGYKRVFGFEHGSSRHNPAFVEVQERSVPHGVFKTEEHRVGQSELI